MTIKERMIKIILEMKDDDLYKALKLLEPFEEEEASIDELEAIKKFNNGDDEYSPYITHEDLKKELGL